MFNYPSNLHIILLLTVFALGLTELSAPLRSHAKPYFEDGYLGLKQAELHKQLGMPMAVRSRKAALRVFSYYTFQDWEKYFSELVAPGNGEDVYTYNRDGTQVRYSFAYTPDLRERTDSPTLYVKRVEIEFTPAVTLSKIPDLISEFSPPTDAKASVFRSNLWLLIFKGAPSPDASFISQEQGRESLPWSLAYQMFAINGLPDYLTLDAKIDRMEITTQSLEIVKTNQRLTHEPILNPFSEEVANRPPPSPAQHKKSIPQPEYAD
ncbi:MAG: hypothetical protein NPIRA02_23000 [Nitrospirales bacterium]|nr:MAG: hypothetical protein NPIRA02_23000 [Nitrospirales bacterium]